ncbi:MAG: pilin [Patescibacteria group bacterium]|nr:pilin [Patescibacteria group bacterium]
MVGRRIASNIFLAIFVLSSIFLATASVVAADTTSTNGEGNEAQVFQAEVPKLNVPIPGLTFSSDIQVTQNEKIAIPFLAQYITALIKYFIGIVLIATAIMLVYGGFLYIIGTTSGDVQKGKEKIKDALFGLGLVMGSYTLLNMVIPNFSKSLKPIEIQYVQPEKFDVLSPAQWKEITQSAGTPTGSSSYGYDPSECKFKMNSVGIPTLESMVECAVIISKRLGLNPCYAIVAMNYETGGLALPGIIGHDEYVYAVGQLDRFLGTNPPDRSLVHYWVSAGRAYLESGVTYKDVKFPKCTKTCGKGECSTGEELQASIQNYKNCKASAPRNDDVPDPSKTDLGLDWRFSHGIGPGQTTLFSKSCNKDIPSKSFGGICFTAQQLNEPYAGIWTSLVILKEAGAGDPGDVDRAWAGYAGSASAQSAARAAMTRSCNPKNPIMTLKSDGFTICRGDWGNDREACEKMNDDRKLHNSQAQGDKDKLVPLINCTASCGIGYLSSLGIKGAGCDTKKSKKPCPLLTFPKP